MPNAQRRFTTIAGLVVLLALFVLQLALSSRRNSVTWDEGHHLSSGYLSLTSADYGLNPEVPPLVKMVSAVPLLGMPLHMPPLQGRFFKDEAFFGGRDFLFGNDFNRVLFRARMAAMLFSLLLAALIFAAAREMFSTTAGFIALALLVFDPNFLAHGALVTTDAGSALTIFATVYAWYRWRKSPTWTRVLLVGVAAGLALVTKFTGVLVFPMLAVLVLCELTLSTALKSESRSRLAVRLVGGLALTCGLAWLLTWVFYGFRYAARPAGLALNPSLAGYLPLLANQRSAHTLALLGRFHLMPESWLYGLADTKITADSYTSYFNGHVYPHGNWLYFPEAFAIKSTLPFLILFLLALILILLRRLNAPREILYLTLPPILYFLVAMTSNMNIGARHLLPIYPFLYILGAGGAWVLIRSRHVWLVPIAALVLWQAVDSVYMYPAYMAFGNDLWGGPPAVHKYLSDANVDWGQQLNDVRTYLNARGIYAAGWTRERPISQVATPAGYPFPPPQCWFAYFPDGVVDPAAYGIPCRRLPTANTLLWMHEPTSLPASINGIVLISDSDLEGIEFGEGALNPYEQFRHLRPTALIDYGIDVYQGHFDIPLAAGLNDTEIANQLLKQNHPDQALTVAQLAVSLAPNLVNPQVALGDALSALHRPDEARACYQRALSLAETVEPQLQTGWVHDLKTKLGAR